ncbi:MAG: trypsin-like peptidase domain-containing protein [Bdellovibrionaceae bacterium]|nr:trypsin-like peptidase domain-containing protein [Pseudobdellovibrionaceae bacterium]MCB9093224.1 trypsin-like peptidase domain-containing protein [Halobacteriovoraceae bacterium]
MGVRTLKIVGLVLFLGIFQACTKTETKTVEVPKVKTVEVPSTPTVIEVPKVILTNNIFGLPSMPTEIKIADEKTREMSKAVAKVFRFNGASGSGFFISPDGLFITNQHVVPRKFCTTAGCPGFKIVRDFGPDGENQELSDFTVIAHDNSQDLYDFTILKFNLPEGQSVPFLRLDADVSAHQFDVNTSITRYKALGYPGGASLRFTAMKPIAAREENIILQGLVMGGNSGGPLIDVDTGKVVGLMKNTRIAPVKESNFSATLETLSQATAISILVEKIGERFGNDVVGEGQLRADKLISAHNSADNDFFPNIVIPEPSLDTFSGALRREMATAQFMEAFEAFGMYVGTEKETEVLDLMLVKNQYTPEPINIESLNKLLSYSLSIGRSLNFSSLARDQLESAISLAADGSDNASPKMTANIAFNYFDESKKQELQGKCAATTPNFVQAYSMLPYICLSLKNNDGESILPPYVEFALAQEYQTVDDFGVLSGLLMFASQLGISNSQDKAAIQKLNDFIHDQQKDLENLFVNDSFAQGLLSGVVGIGSYGQTFPGQH